MGLRSSGKGGDARQANDWRDRALRRLVSHAYRRVPFYRELYDQHGVSPAAIRGIGDLAALPVTDKAGYREAGAARFLADGRDPGTLVFHETHGSTGEPFLVYRTWTEERWLSLFRWRTLIRWGVRPTDRAVRVLHIAAPGPGDRNSPHAVLMRLGLMRRELVSCLLPPEEIARELARRRPEVIGGYAATLAAVAQGLLGGRVAIPAPRLVTTGGEVVTAATRRLLTRAFAAPVFETYGAHEVNEIAWQCPRSGELHVREETLALEVLKDGRPARPGEAGEVHCTALWSYAMPFIRYRLGDLAVVADGPCACGRSGLRLRSIAGRTVDYFRLPEGRQVHPYELCDHGLEEEWIAQYQLVQERRDHVVVTLIPARPVQQHEREQVRRRLQTFFGDQVVCDLVFADRIDPSPTGKPRTYLSKVKA